MMSSTRCINCHPDALAFKPRGIPLMEFGGLCLGLATSGGAQALLIIRENIMSSRPGDRALTFGRIVNEAQAKGGRGPDPGQGPEDNIRDSQEEDRNGSSVSQWRKTEGINSAVYGHFGSAPAFVRRWGYGITVGPLPRNPIQAIGSLCRRGRRGSIGARPFGFPGSRCMCRSLGLRRRTP